MFTDTFFTVVSRINMVKFLLSLILLSAAKMLVIVSSAECFADQFKCKNGRCINVAYVCDDEDDCMDFTDELNCRKELISENFLIVADSVRRNLYQISIDTGEMVPLLPVRPTQPIAVAYDEVNNVVYWTDVQQRSIGRFAIGDRLKTIQTIFTDTDASAALEGLAIDTTRQKLYYCDAGDVGRIGEISADGSHRRILVEERGTKPRSIVLDLNNRLMYWSDWGDTASIMRANMLDGSQKQMIVTGALVWPNALAVDFYAQTMFWGDANLGKIEMSRTDGTGRQVIYSNSPDSYYSIAVSPQYLYVTDWTKRAVRKLDRQTFSISNQAPAVFSRLNGIVYCRCNQQSTVTLMTTASTSYITSTPRSSTSDDAIVMSIQDSITTMGAATNMSVVGIWKPSQTSETHSLPKLFLADDTLVTLTSVAVGGIVIIVIVITIGAVVAGRKRTRSRCSDVSTASINTPTIDNNKSAAATRMTSVDNAYHYYDDTQQRAYNVYETVPQYYDMTSSAGARDATCSDEYLVPAVGTTANHQYNNTRMQMDERDGYEHIRLGNITRCPSYCSLPPPLPPLATPVHYNTDIRRK